MTACLVRSLDGDLEHRLVDLAGACQRRMGVTREEDGE